ncbi:MgtC/SapB family protein [Roseivirga echinicomitans]|uniref:Magnesium transporter n=1 Tax=Roseivirga echinicomitans TaxID=296218 RepID=A0A150X146_9BACT|nr:MgtC/SapB family protein [Roseivirga echinicomitans]KYG72450.1 magnesium transporter [Roseivirga echinicomitans]
MEIDHQELEILLNVLVATVLCGLVGYERENKDKPAGLKTNMIVGGFSCLIVSLSLPLIDFVHNYEFQEAVKADPIRILQALVVGISFIGPGTIIKQNHDKVKGLTTAATLLYCLGIGISIALHKYIIAIGITLIILMINYSFTRLKEKIIDK